MTKRMVSLESLLLILSHVQTPSDPSENLNLMRAIAGLNLKGPQDKSYGLEVTVIRDTIPTEGYYYSSKIRLIKFLRSIFTSIGLKDSKDFVDTAENGVKKIAVLFKNKKHADMFVSHFKGDLLNLSGVRVVPANKSDFHKMFPIDIPEFWKPPASFDW